MILGEGNGTGMKRKGKKKGEARPATGDSSKTVHSRESNVWPRDIIDCINGFWYSVGELANPGVVLTKVLYIHIYALVRRWVGG